MKLQFVFGTGSILVAGLLLVGCSYMEGDTQTIPSSSPINSSNKETTEHPKVENSEIPRIQSSIPGKDQIIWTNYYPELQEDISLFEKIGSCEGLLNLYLSIKNENGSFQGTGSATDEKLISFMSQLITPLNCN